MTRRRSTPFTAMIVAAGNPPLDVEGAMKRVSAVVEGGVRYE